MTDEWTKHDKARDFLKNAINHDEDLYMMFLANCRTLKTKRLYRTRHISHISGEFAIRHNGRMFILDIFPSSCLYEFLPQTTGKLFPDSDAPIDAEFNLNREPLLLPTLQKLLLPPKEQMS